MIIYALVVTYLLGLLNSCTQCKQVEHMVKHTRYAMFTGKQAIWNRLPQLFVLAVFNFVIHEETQTFKFTIGTKQFGIRII